METNRRMARRSAREQHTENTYHEEMSMNAMENPRPLVHALQQNIRKAIVGKDEAIELMLIALICRGHVLIEDVPGVGKTTLVSALEVLLQEYGVWFLPVRPHKACTML